MCGITGWVDFARDLTSARPTVESMTRALRNRGPDAEGFWLDRHVALGHTRLAVIDLAGGAQPMVAEEGGRTSAVLTYGGEVYNFRALRDELRRAGHEFRTDSDTEVVLRAYREWGADCVRRLEGMFAIAVWDPRREELFLARDRLGIKPLFYAPLPSGVLFGSEPKALLANPLIRPVVDREGLRELLSTAKTPGRSVFRDLRELKPGHSLVVSRRGLREQRYWELRAEPHTDDLGTTIDTVRTLLDDIVLRELVSDVPLCTALSGGLDSSALTAVAAAILDEQGGRRVRTVTTGFEGYHDNFRADDTRSAPDAPYAAEVVRRVGSDHVDILLNTADLTDPATRLAAVRAQDMATSYGDMDVSLHRTFRRIRQHNTVALIGEGADETFGGYIWLHLDEYAQAPTFPWVAMEQLHEACRPAGMGRGLLDAGLLDKVDMAGHYADSYRQACAEAPHPDGESALDHRMRELCYLQVTRWLPMLLDRDDRLSMDSGLEVRVPFCDHRLVQYLYNVPWAMKTFDGREKSLLRAALAGRLPERVLQRAKSPWPVTQDPAYTRALQRELSGLLAADSPVLSLVDAGAARRAITDTSEIAFGWHSRMNIELVLQLDLWLRDYDVDLAL
ncbi:asparagine synthase (glutamine-hydrolyzing) [Amycolatopsis thermalba]|uniref:asparagine synthase (glutamine-hydrolyzing) n=1 Tax=Amycolatopsis thermalba TaxID=944492 RepID=A0ABY4NTS0_9PSEU|nr:MULTISPECIES: asparagine synthase (glutamine-hydrolyzing) [Amycolatopsis]UQS23484.1 asparagine synthase (glutamine-hydrolyzing) [Amycolatopsis thermalba]